MPGRTVVGPTLGALVRLLMPGKAPWDITVVLLVAVLGGPLRGFVSSRASGRSTGSLVALRTCVIALIGAPVLPLIYRPVAGRART